jgi:hypothetical protein
MCACAEPELRAGLVAAARSLGEAAKYRSAGTVEFLVDQDTAKFYFREVNTRLQARPPLLFFLFFIFHQLEPGTKCSMVSILRPLLCPWSNAHSATGRVRGITACLSFACMGDPECVLSKACRDRTCMVTMHAAGRMGIMRRHKTAMNVVAVTGPLRVHHISR